MQQRKGQKNIQNLSSEDRGGNGGGVKVDSGDPNGTLCTLV